MKNKKIILYTWSQLLEDIDNLERQLKFTASNYKNIYGVPRGGLIPAIMLSHRLNLPMTTRISDATLIVDDISDTGKTLKKIASKKNIVVTLWITPHTKFEPFIYCRVLKKDEWVVFPFETLTSSQK